MYVDPFDEWREEKSREEKRRVRVREEYTRANDNEMRLRVGKKMFLGDDNKLLFLALAGKQPEHLIWAMCWLAYMYHMYM